MRNQDFTAKWPVVGLDNKRKNIQLGISYCLSIVLDDDAACLVSSVGQWRTERLTTPCTLKLILLKEVRKHDRESQFS